MTASQELLHRTPLEHETSVTKKAKRMFLDWKEAIGLGLTVLFGGISGYALAEFVTYNHLNSLYEGSFRSTGALHNDIAVSGIALGLSLVSGFETLHHRKNRVEKRGYFVQPEKVNANA